MGEFHTITKASEVTPGEMMLVDDDGEEIVIANVAGEYFAFSDTCTHEGGPLSDGELEGHIVTCPWHFTPFDVKTGEAQEGGVTDDPIPVYEVRVKGDEVQIRKP